MKAIIAAFQLAMTTLKAKADAALETIKSPIDQIQSAGEVAAAINTLKWCQESVKEWLTNVAALEAKFDEEVESAVAAKVAAMVAAGEYVASADVAAAVSAAELKGRTDAEGAFAAAAAAAKLISDRRAEVAAAHGADAAAGIPDEALAGDDTSFAGFKNEFGRRVAALSALGVTASAEKTRPAFADIACGISFSDEGAQAFDGRLAVIKALIPAGGVAASAAPGVVPGSGQPPAATGGTPPSAPTTAPVVGF